jgi:alginate O-acetyltransferase complex protein AlgJ
MTEYTQTTKLQSGPVQDGEFAQDTLKANLDNPAAPRLLHWLPGLFLGAVVLVGAGAALFAPGTWTSPKDKSVMIGSWQGAFERNYDAQHPVRTPGIDSFGLLNYSAFGEGRPGVLVGEGGWLYTTEEFQTAATDPAQIEAKLTEIRGAQATLAAQGAQLMVLLIPAKSRVYPEHLGRYRWPTVKRNVYEAFRQQLDTMGVSAPDLLPALVAAKARGEVFLHTDTHWTPLGAQVAADTVRTTIASMPKAPELPGASFAVRSAPLADYSGDLLKYIPLGRWQKTLGPQPDRLGTPSASRTDSGGAGLLGEDAPAVTLVGTSYSANARWGFEALLKQTLGTDIVNAAQEGKGPMVPMREYLKSEAYKSAAPKLVIWEIPERFLTVRY